jgi:hypothetical protein
MISPLANEVANIHQRALVDAGVLVRALELAQPVDVDARLRGIGLFRRADNDTSCIDLVDDTRPARHDRSTGISGNDFFHAGADQRRFRT